MLCRSVRFPLMILLLAALTGSLRGQTSFYREEQILEHAGFQENVEVRSGMKESITAPFFSLLTRQKEIHEQILSPAAVEFELRKSAESFYLLFKNEQNYRYPVWGRGNYIIKRDLKTGDFQQIKIFLQNDENAFIRLFPLDKKRSVMDMMLYGAPLYSGIVIPVSLQELAVTSFTRLMHLTRGTVRWEDLFSNRRYPEWRTISSLLDSVNENLPRLHERDDGAQDGTGRFVLIEDGRPVDEPGGVNCSGFAKWVADGILLGEGETMPGSLIPLNELKVPTETESARLKNPWNTAREDRDPYFGLDWTRNLARYLARHGADESLPGGTALDVTHVPFFYYRENIGYKLDNLQAVLYLLAVENPGAFFMGSVNSLFGEDPVLWQYHHVALFFPWFDQAGDFHLAVLETGRSSSLENLMSRYPDSYVHLVRVDGAEQFKNPAETD